MFDVSDLRPTIVPRSDQLNAEQLLAGPMVLTVTDVRAGSEDQPVVVHYEGDNGRPFKPCKTMRKVLILAWGPDGRQWIGKSMRVYNDTSVRFGGTEVGGIRISHMTDIERDIRVSLTATKGKKALNTVERMDPPTDAHLSAINAAATEDELRAAYMAAKGSTRDRSRLAEYAAAKDARKAAIQQPAQPDADAPDPFVAEMDAAAKA